MVIVTRVSPPPLSIPTISDHLWPSLIISKGDYIWIEPQTKREFDVAIGARVIAAEGRRIQVVDDDTKVGLADLSIGVIEWVLCLPISGTMADSGEKDQSDAPDFGSGRRRHDFVGRLAWGGNTAESVDQIQWKCHLCESKHSWRPILSLCVLRPIPARYWWR